jgi:hypothetical protein
MVVVNYIGRLGNNLFQYALGRYIAEEMDYALVANPLPFPPTFERVSGRSVQGPVQKLGKQLMDIQSFLDDKSDRLILLDGFFQYFQYYSLFLDRIRKWYSGTVPPCATGGIHSDDLLVYVRLSDYCRHGW